MRRYTPINVGEPLLYNRPCAESNGTVFVLVVNSPAVFSVAVFIFTKTKEKKMNGYIVWALDIMLVVALWTGFGMIAGLIGLLYVLATGAAFYRYNAFAVHVITTMREKIEELTGRPYTGPTE